MKILALERSQTPIDSSVAQALLEAEAQALWQRCMDGAIRSCDFHAERHEAVLLLECTDVAEAHQVLQGLPLVQAGWITFELLPLVPYDGFARLFREHGPGLAGSCHRPVAVVDPTEQRANA